jgi:hypothetical protein
VICLKVMSLIATAVILLSAAAAVAAEEKKKSSGEACRAACEARLKANGTWTKMPYGTCRKRCGMPL